MENDTGSCNTILCLVSGMMPYISDQILLSLKRRDLSWACYHLLLCWTWKYVLWPCDDVNCQDIEMYNLPTLMCPENMFIVTNKPWRAGYD